MFFDFEEGDVWKCVACERWEWIGADQRDEITQELERAREYFQALEFRSRGRPKGSKGGYKREVHRSERGPKLELITGGKE